MSKIHKMALVKEWKNLSGFFLQILHDQADELDEGDDESAESDRAEVVPKDPPDADKHRQVKSRLVAGEVPRRNGSSDNLKISSLIIVKHVILLKIVN